MCSEAARHYRNQKCLAASVVIVVMALIVGVSVVGYHLWISKKVSLSRKLSSQAIQELEDNRYNQGSIKCT